MGQAYRKSYSKKKEYKRANDWLSHSEDEENEFDVSSKSVLNNKSNTQLFQTSQKLNQMQQNDLFHESNQRCAHFRKHSISTPGSSEESSELGTVCDLEERSPSTETYDKIEHDDCIGGLNRCDVVEYSLESQCDALNEDGVGRSNYQIVSGISTLGHPTTYSSLSNFEKPLPEGSNIARKTFAAWVR